VSVSPRFTTIRIAVATVLFAAACMTTGASHRAPLEPRYVAIHNAFAALGLAEIGPIHQGTLREGKEAHVALGILSACTTIATVGDDGVRDIHATLVDEAGRAQAHDTTSEPQAILNFCPESPQPYELVVRVTEGNGAWMAAAYQGAAIPRDAPAPGANSPADRQGTCSAPIAIEEGVVRGSTMHGQSDNEGSCAPSDAREIVYRLDVPERANVTLDLESHFDAVLYVRNGDCSDSDSEVACDDDSPDQTHSHIEQTFEPGTYFVFVDGYNREEGAFKLTVSTSSAQSRYDGCGSLQRLVVGQDVAGDSTGGADSVHSSCAGGAQGPDSAWRLDIPSRSRIRISERAKSDFSPVVHMRRICENEASEVACSDSGFASNEATILGLFDSGRYVVFADARDKTSGGEFLLDSEMSPPDGDSANASGDCGDVAPLPPSPVQGDTFSARDHAAASCGGDGAPDVVYRLDIARRSRFAASFASEESVHLIGVSSRCGDRASEVACGAAVDAVLAPGSYFVAVDGASVDAFGRFALAWATEDLSGQAVACASATPIEFGRTFKSSTQGQASRYSASCALPDASATGSDRIFRLDVQRRRRVRLSLAAEGFDAALALRKDCEDGPGSRRSPEVFCVLTAQTAKNHAPTLSLANEASIDRVLEAGTYWVLVDGQTRNASGPFWLRVE